MGSVFAVRVGRNQFLPLLDLERPAPANRLFTTLADAQRKAIFQFYYRTRPGSPWRPVGRIEWEGLAPSRAGEPTLELQLTPGRAGNLLLRLRERSSGMARSYRLRLPDVPMKVPLETPLEAPPSVVRLARQAAPREAPPAHEREAAPSAPARRERQAPQGTARRGGPPAGKRIRRRAIGAALAGVLLAIAVVLLIRFTPVLDTLSGSKPAVGSTTAAASKPAAGETPAPPPPPLTAVEPAGPGESGLEAADGVSGASPRQPAAHESQPGATDPRPEAKPPAEEHPKALSYRVQWGDTLWQITEQYYGNPYLYSLLAGENAIVDPDLIIPGTELRLPPRIDDRDRK